MSSVGQQKTGDGRQWGTTNVSISGIVLGSLSTCLDGQNGVLCDQSLGSRKERGDGVIVNQYEIRGVR